MINLDITNDVEIFVEYSGPKLSYSNKPLRDEFFIKSHSLLFEQGIIEQKLKLDFGKNFQSFFTNANAIVLLTYLLLVFFF